MKLAASAPTTDGSESLATDTFGIEVPSHDQERAAIGDPWTSASEDPGEPLKHVREDKLPKAPKLADERSCVAAIGY